MNQHTLERPNFLLSKIVTAYSNLIHLQVSSLPPHVLAWLQQSRVLGWPLVSVASPHE